LSIPIASGIIVEERKYIMRNLVDLNELIGKVFTSVVADDYEVIFENDKETYKLYHEQDCCENVEIEDICGDIADLVGVEIVVADEVSNISDEQIRVLEKKYDDSYEWTFYRFRTIKGTVTIRFYGTSNGYYATGVDFIKVR